MAAAVSRISPMGFGMGPASILAWVEAPHGSLIPRPSTGLPFGHIVAPPDRLDARQAGERFDFPLAPALDYAREAAVALDQKHAGHAGNPECVPRREAAPPGIEQRGKREAELPVELPGIFGVVLRDGVDRQRAALVDALEKRERELAHGTRGLKKGDQGRAVGEDLLERYGAAIQLRQTDIRRARTGVEEFALFADHDSSVPLVQFHLMWGGQSWPQPAFSRLDPLESGSAA